jgi:uncharacterized membrane protein
MLAFYYLSVNHKPLSSDVTRYFDYASKIVQGQLPYHDFTIEYPPLALVFFLLPRLITSQPAVYGALFAAEMIILDCLALVLIANLSRQLKINMWASLAISTVTLIAIGPIILQRYDLVPAVMTLAAIYAFSRQMHKTAWLMLAVATMTKLYPVILAPVFLLANLKLRQFRPLVHGICAFAAGIGIIVLSCLWLSPSGFWESFSYHIGRGLQCESTYASFLLFGRTINLTTLRFAFGGGSINITSPLADMFAGLSPVILVISLFAVYWVFWRKIGKNGLLEAVVDFSLLAIIVFMITSKILSPQFIIWLYPMVPLVTGKWRPPSWAFFVVIGIMTWYVFPAHYQQLIMSQPEVIDILLWRNVLLIAWAFLLASDKQAEAPLLKYPSSDKTTGN